MNQAVRDIAKAARPAPARMSPRRKAAIIVRLLIGEGVALPLDTLPEALQADLADALADLRFVDAETLHEIVLEFIEAMERVGLTFPGGVEGALGLLEGHITQEAAAQIRARAVAAGRGPDPWARIAAQEPALLSEMLAGETPEVASVVLSKLPNPRAAEILGMLPGERARRIAMAISQTAKVAPDTVRRIGEALAEAIDQRPVAAFEAPAERRMGDILNITRSATREDVLTALEARDAALAARVRRTILVFGDLPERLASRDVPTLTRALPQEVLITALKAALADDADDANEMAAEFILTNMSQRMAGQLREEMEERGPVLAKEAEAALNRVIMVLRELEAAGDITLAAHPDLEENGG